MNFVKNCGYWCQDAYFCGSVGYGANSKHSKFIRVKQVFLETHNLNNPHSGFGQFNYRLLHALAQLDTSAYKITVNTGNSGRLKREFGDRFHYNHYFSFTRYPAFRIRKKYDLWHSTNQNTKIEPYHDLPYVLTIHDIDRAVGLDGNINTENFERLQAKINRSSAITYISEFAKASTAQYFDLPDVPQYVIYNGNPIEGLSLAEGFEPKIKPEGPFLFTIGQITERKNFKTLIGMLERLKDLTLVISGKDTTETAKALQALIQQKKLQDRVFLTGTVSDNERLYYYKNCQAFVFPTLREGFGFPVIEAMHFGKPVFTSNTTSLPEVGGSAAFYWEHYDPDYMAGVFEDGMQQFQSRQEAFSEKIKAQAAKFTWEVAAKQYHEVYTSLLNR